MLGQPDGEGLFEFVAALEVHTLAAVQRLLRQGQCVTALRGDGPCAGECGVHERVVGDYLDRRAPPLEGVCVDGFCGEEQPAHCLLRQHAGGEAAAAQYPDVHFRQPERRLFRRHHEVARCGQAKSAA